MSLRTETPAGICKEVILFAAIGIPLMIVFNDGYFSILGDILVMMTLIRLVELLLCIRRGQQHM